MTTALSAEPLLLGFVDPAAHVKESSVSVPERFAHYPSDDSSWCSESHEFSLREQEVVAHESSKREEEVVA